MMSKGKILLTGGGTAGHIWPIIAVAEILEKNARIKFLYVGSYGGPEKNIAKDFGVPFRRVLVGKWRNYFSLSNFWDLIKTFIGIVQALFIVLFFKPNVIFAKGGYVTVPVLFWANLFKISVITHESDIILGKANRWAAKFAKKICLGFPLKYYQGLDNLPIEKFVYTGTPVRKEFLGKTPIEREKPTILFTGGSQGSAKMNLLISEILPELIKKYEILHLAGEKKLENLKESENYHPIGFSKEMARLMRNADLIITRAGANTLAEISALGKPAVLIPLPTAYLDHQNANAQIYQEHNAAVVCSEKNLTGSSLLSIIDRLMEDDKLRYLLGHHAKEFSRPDAGQEIIDLLFEYGGNND